MFDFEMKHLLEYTAWEREQWRTWFLEQGPSALAVDLGPHADGPVKNAGELLRHIFAAEQRYVDRIRGVPVTDPSALPSGDVEALFAFGRRSRAALEELLATFPTERWDVPQEVKIGPQAMKVTPRKMVAQAVTHEMRHWAQLAVFLRISGRKPGPRDLLVSPVFDPPVAGRR